MKFLHGIVDIIFCDRWVLGRTVPMIKENVPNTSSDTKETRQQYCNGWELPSPPFNLLRCLVSIFHCDMSSLASVERTRIMVRVNSPVFTSFSHGKGARQTVAVHDAFRKENLETSFTQYCFCRRHILMS